MPTIRVPPPAPGKSDTPLVVKVRPRASIGSLLSTTAIIALVAGGGFLGYRLIRADLAASVYKDRLTTMAGDYETLRRQYNDAVARTAVTELVVKDGKLSVRIRNDAGLVDEIAAPYDPAGEIYVDYVVVGQRLWIRRVFDARTSPEKGLVLDPALARVDWNDPSAAHGKAVYRRLGEGRWRITVTGDGSLGLVRAPDNEPAELTRAPEIKDHSKLPDDTKRDVERIGVGDVWRWMTDE